MRRAAISTTLLILLASTTSVATAQWGPPGPPQNAFQVRLGYFWLDDYRDDGFWADTEDVFTLSASDFRGFSFGFTYVRSLENWLELGLNLDFFDVRVLEMEKRNEYKRRQSPPGVRISGRAFGRDWRYPITSGYKFPQ